MTKIITQEMIEERLDLYKKEVQQLQELSKVYEGAIQDCNHWLNQLKEEVKIDEVHPS